MKTTPPNRNTTARSPRSTLAWYLCLAGAFLACCCGLGILLVSAKTESATGFRQPPGQLLADTRTAFAALNFLLDNRPEIEASPATVSDSDRVTGGMLGATGEPCEMLACPSNQAELNCGSCFTNPPVRG